MAMHYVKSSSLLATVCLQILLTTAPARSTSTDEGTDLWSDQMCTTGRRQSPVDITSVGLREARIAPLVFEEYQIPYETLISRKDFSVALQYPGDITEFPAVRGGKLQGKYVFSGLHFHWGAGGEQGSEHRLEGRQFGGEMHMVHYKSSYDTIEEALHHRGGVAVVATWLEEEDEHAALKDHNRNPGYQWMKDLAENYINSEGESSAGTEDLEVDESDFAWAPLALKDLLTSEPEHFFRYNGSLTTSPCSESVVWTVFRFPITVPSAFVKMLHQRETTVRSPQPLNNRTILYSGDMMSYYSGGGLAPSPSVFWLLPAVCVLLKLAV